MIIQVDLKFYIYNYLNDHVHHYLNQFCYISGAYALGSIDPTLYKIVDEDDTYEIPVDHIGRLWFAVEYERETEKLLVTLIKAKNLPTRQYGNNSSCDPFVRLIYLKLLS